jgi:hypothetical protein
MPVRMSGSPQAGTGSAYSPMQGARHVWDTSQTTQALMGGMVFDPARGGWVQPDAARPNQTKAMPTHWATPIEAVHGAHSPSKMDKWRQGEHTHHFESRHESAWRLDMKAEVNLGLAPPEWSTSSQMNDIRPNGKALFDARFSGNAMGRARGGYSMMADARGMESTAGKLQKAENMDSSWFATDMADETAAAEASAELNKYGTNTNFGSVNSAEQALAQMSQLQRRQLDKDGDGNYSAEELKAFGLSVG